MTVLSPDSHQREERVRAFFQQPDRYLGKSFVVRVRQRIVRDLLGDLRNQRILDVGCGDGRVSMPARICPAVPGRG
ncbi:MAG: hypothetical protein HY701_13110 [Gemmatimonadetes bacterium]|nr:hypothetical protein [Gemmatimonadota bacterium]